MRSVVVFKWAVDPKDLRVNADGTVDWSTGSPWVGDDDYMAAQIACSASGEDGEVIGLTLAGGDVAFAAARGADRTIAIEGILDTADVWTIAQALAAAINRIGDVDVVAIGDCAWEPALPVVLAGLLGWPALMSVDSAERKAEGLFVTRRFGMKTQEIAVTGKILLGVAAKREEENKPGMRAVIKARKKPVAIWSAEELRQEEMPYFHSQGTRLPEREPSKLFDGADPDRAAGQLLQALQTGGVL